MTMSADEIHDLIREHSDQVAAVRATMNRMPRFKNGKIKFRSNKQRMAYEAAQRACGDIENITDMFRGKESLPDTEARYKGLMIRYWFEFLLLTDPKLLA